MSKLTVELMCESNALVTRYASEPDFQDLAYEVLGR